MVFMMYRMVYKSCEYKNAQEMHKNMHRIHQSDMCFRTIYLNLHVFDCVCMYLGFLELYQVHMCMYVVNVQSRYRQIHTHMQFSGQCISVCK
jgi:hypothetical protein